MALFYLVARIIHKNSYFGHRGHNLAYATEDLTKSWLVFMMFVSLFGSLKIFGLMKYPKFVANSNFLQKWLPKRLKKAPTI